MSSARASHELSLIDVRHAPAGDPGVEHVDLVTDRGVIGCRRHDAAAGDAAVLWVFGAGGGFHGPAGGLYDRLGAALAPNGLASLQVAYRRPADLLACVLDVLVAVGYLAESGRTRVVLVGHSFGGAVVITAGAESDAVIAVAALSSQTAGTADEVLPAQCSRDIYARAAEPKRLILYPDCRHGLDGCRDALDADLSAWLRDAAGLPTAP